jgi:hypothetical protein
MCGDPLPLYGDDKRQEFRAAQGEMAGRTGA